MDWAYLAAFIDGEGCISTSKRAHGRGYGPQVTMKQVYPESLVWLYKTFQCGTLSPRSRDVWWRLRKIVDVMWILEGSVPYLHLKRKQALACLRICQRPIEVKEMERLHWLLRELKRPARGL